MLRNMCKGKIHRATVTGADVDYEGSVTIDENLLEASGILPYEKVEIYNVTNGNRLETYAITGERGKGDICLNGAAAHLVDPGDLVIICHYALMDDAEARALKPKLVFVDSKNRPVRREIDHEVPGPHRIEVPAA